jgi:nanoRNase/pAp phosphatase (c-di-AMP/oligoRNAs hydrolase)
MQQELTPKQQAVELIKQANHILLVSGREPNNDQLSAMVALDLILQRAGKQVSAIMTGDMPKAAKILDVRGISRDLTGIRDFIIRLDTSSVEVDKLRYETNDNNLEVIISPFSGNFTDQNVSYDYGAYKFDLVIVLGASQISRIDKILQDNPTIFDGIHLINIDCHSSNENYGSVNYVEPYASSVSEMLVGVMESVAQGMIDYHVATAVLTGIMAATKGFTGPNTSAKSLTIAAQMMSAGAKQQDIVNALFSQAREDKPEPKKVESKDSQSFSIMNPPKIESKQESKPKADAKPEQKAETIADKLAKQGVELTAQGVKDAKTGEVVKDEAKDSEDEQSPKKFKNPSQKHK